MLFFLALIIVVSGVVAYVGDWIGRKMGRRRLTLFGLRPRHTAIIISVSGGMALAALTLAAAFLISKPIRDAFIIPVDTLRVELERERQAVADVEVQLGRARGQVARLHTQLTADTNILSATRSRLTQSLAQRELIHHALTDAQHELDGTVARLHDNQQQLLSARRELASAQRADQRIHSELDAAGDRLVGVSKIKLRLDSDLLRLEATRDEYQRRINELSERVDVLSQFAMATFAPLAYTAGQEIVSGVFATTMSLEESKRQVAAFFLAGEHVIRQQYPEYPREASFFIFIGTTGPHPVKLTREEAIGQLATKITHTSGVREVIVRLAPANNVPVNSPALIAVDSLAVIPNLPAYAAGDEVARLPLRVATTSTTATILRQIMDELLTTRVPAALRAHHVEMVTRRFDVNHPELVPTATQSLVSWDDLLAVAERLRAQGGALQIVARTKSTVTRYGPVELTFEVLPGS